MPIKFQQCFKDKRNKQKTEVKSARRKTLTYTSYGDKNDSVNDAAKGCTTKVREYGNISGLNSYIILHSIAKFVTPTIFSH